jgi:hypothetical protein
MCLFKAKGLHPFNRPLIAEEDIVCYKQLDISRFTNGYITPCTYSVVPAECLEKKVPFKAEILNKFMFIWRHVLGFSNMVTDGFIHSHVYIPFPSFFYCTFECIIPKGTKYFIGTNDDYASEQIIFLRRVR